MMKKTALLAAIGLGLLTPLHSMAQAPAETRFGHYRPAPQFSDTVTSRIYLPLRDGVRVAVRIDRPAVNGTPAEGRFPVIWQHTLSTERESPWNGSAPGLPQLPELTRHGYVVIQVARRGNGQSLGEMRGYHDRNEAQDAYELTQWMAEQPWSNGKVGIYGCSNTGDAAMQALTVRPPALKAAFAGCFSWHKYDAFRRGGIFAQWGTGPNRTIEQDMAQKPIDGDESKVLLRQAAEEHQRSVKLIDLWTGLPYRNSYSPLVASRFWQEGSSANYLDQIRRSGVAVYILGGWYDELRDQGLIAWANIPGTRIVIGPWRHCKNDDFPLLDEAHRFFDQHLKGIDTGLSAQEPIHYYTINAPAGQEWRAASAWPLPGTEMRSLYLGGDGALRSAPSGARAAARVFDVKYDIACPDKKTGPFEGGPFAQPCFVPGAGLSYADRPLARDTEVTGSPVVDLWAAADAPDANLFAYLEDVAPDGAVRVVTEGRLKASVRQVAAAPWKIPGNFPWHRAFAEDVQLLTPGQPVNLAFDMMPTSYVFKAGHRIQITIRGADERERLRGEGLARRITVLADKAHPSLMRVPVVNAAHAVAVR
jgi:putative CocE/NonD family hydrolase